MKRERLSVFVSTGFMVRSSALRPLSRLWPEKHRISPLHRRAVKGPAVALAQVVGRFGDFGLGLASQFAAVPLACGQGLVGGSGHVEQQLAQVGAAFGAANVRVDDFAPARAHGLADQPVHVVRRLSALGVRDVVHRGGDVLDDHFVVECDADFQSMDGLVAGKHPLIGNLKTVGLDVGQFGFDVPQAVFAVIACVNDGSRM